MKLSEFDFNLPEELIASKPLEKRDSSRMLCIDFNGEICDKHIRDILDFFESGDVLVMNNSKVIPARFIAKLERTAHEFEITLHTKESDKIWYGMCKGSRKIKPEEILELKDGTKIKVLEKSDESGLKLEFLTNEKNIFEILNRVGTMPIPPYMKRPADSTDFTRYQTVYAKPLGSMAAPTAGLHLTTDLLEEIKNKGVKIVPITLHVGAGTFLPVKEENIEEHKMHSEYGEITQEACDIINSAKLAGHRIFSVGTTSLRLLESAAKNGKLAPYFESTNIFITPGYKFQIVDVLLTNFHLPKSTLFMLVSAFSGREEMKQAYQHAIDEKYRFFSYGDCCLLKKSN